MNNILNTELIPTSSVEDTLWFHNGVTCRTPDLCVKSQQALYLFWILRVVTTEGGSILWHDFMPCTYTIVQAYNELLGHYRTHCLAPTDESQDGSSNKLICFGLYSRNVIPHRQFKPKTKITRHHFNVSIPVSALDMSDKASDISNRFIVVAVSVYDPDILKIRKSLMITKWWATPRHYKFEQI